MSEIVFSQTMNGVGMGTSPDVLGSPDSSSIYYIDEWSYAERDPITQQATKANWSPCLESGLIIRGDVTLVIKDGVNVTINSKAKLDPGYNNDAGIQCNGEGNWLTICGGNDYGKSVVGNGRMNAYGGAKAAGLGGTFYGENEDMDNIGSQIIVESGVVYAYGGNDEYGQGGAGIGGAMGSRGCHDIYIKDGYVEAHGGGMAAGIGNSGGDVNSYKSSPNETWYEKDNYQTGTHDIYITGGEVHSYGGLLGAGIGGGSDSDGHNIEITGGIVEAIGGASDDNKSPGGTGIGSGSQSVQYPHGFNIHIGGDAQVTAVGQFKSAAIGSSRNSAGFGILIDGDCSIITTAGDNAAAIGGGKYGKGEYIRLNGGKTVCNKDRSGDTASFTGIGGGQYAGTEAIDIKGNSQIEAYGNLGAAIGSGDGYGYDCHEITISENAYVYARAMNTSDNGAAIGAGHEGEATRPIRIVNSGEGYNVKVDAKALGHGPAIGSSKNSLVGNVAIDSGLHINVRSGTGAGFDKIIDRTYNWDDVKLWQDYIVEMPGTKPTLDLTRDASQDNPIVGYESSTNYTVSSNYIPLANTGYEIKWYSDTEGTKEISIPKYAQEQKDKTNLCIYTCPDITLDDLGITPAGHYYMRAQATYNNEVYQSVPVEYTIEKAKTNVKSDSAQKIYDGTPLKCESIAQDVITVARKYSQQSGSGLNDDPYDQTAKIIEEPAYDFAEYVGVPNETTSVPNTYKYNIKSQYNSDNYDVTSENGTLEVVSVTSYAAISSSNCSVIYDGDDHSLDFRVYNKNQTDITDVFGGDWKYYVSKTNEPGSFEEQDTNPILNDVGKLYVYASVEKDIYGQRVTFTSPVYTLEVTKRNITYTSVSDTHIYDATELRRSSTTDPKDYTVSGDGLAERDSDEVIFDSSAAITTVGSINNSFDVKINDSDDPKNYNVTKIFGKLTVEKNPSPITISTNSHNKKYDGETFIVEDDDYSYTQNVIYTDKGDVLNVSLYYAQDPTTQGYVPAKNVGSYSNSVKEYKVFNKDKVDVTDCYTFTQNNCGDLKINYRFVLFTSESKVFMYDGQEHSAENITVDGDGLVSGEEPLFSGFTKVKEVTEEPVDNKFTYENSTTFSISNYLIKREYGKLMVVNEIGITGANVESYYDGNQHTAPATATGTTNEIEYRTSDDGETWSKWSKEVPSLKDTGFKYVNAKVEDGGQTVYAEYTLKVIPREISIITSSSSKEYDGRALKSNSYEVGGMEFVEGEGFQSVECTGQQTNVGSSENNVKYNFDNIVTKKENYNVSEQLGTLEVTKNTSTPISILTGSSTQKYNACPLTCDTYTVEGYMIDPIEPTKLYGSDLLNVTTTGSITDVGSTLNTCTYSVTQNGQDVTDYYTFTTPTYGTLTVVERNVVIVTDSASKVYDGIPLTKDSYYLNGDGFMGDDGISVEVNGSRLNAGSSQNTCTYTFKPDTKKENYKISTQLGILKVDKRNVCIASGNAISTWSNCPETGLTNNNTCSITEDGFVIGEMEANYPKGNGVCAKPEIQPELNKPVDADNTIEYKWIGNGNPSNYIMKECYGILRITNDKASDAVASSYEGLYDGFEHSGSVVTSLEDPTIEYSTDGGESWSSNKPMYKDATLNSSGEVEAKTVNVKLTKDESKAFCSYTVKIHPRNLTLTAGSKTKVYDASELTCEEYSITGDGFANNTEQSDANISINGKITDVKLDSEGNVVSEPNNITCSEVERGTFNPNNYVIDKIAGSLTITKRQVELISKGFGYTTEELISKGADPDFAKAVGTDPVKYDGKDQYKSGNDAIIEVGNTSHGGIRDIEGMGFVGDQGLDYTNAGWLGFKDAGSYVNTFDIKKATVKIGTNLNNYNIGSTYGGVKIIPRDVLLESESASKLYDGFPLTADTVDASDDGFVGGEGADYDVTGSQTDIGISPNNFTYILKDNTKDINYNITTKEGTLEVYANDTLRLIPPKTEEYTFDGTSHGQPARAFIGDKECKEAKILYSTDGKEYKEGYPMRLGSGITDVTAYVELTGYNSVTASYKIIVKPNDVDNLDKHDLICVDASQYNVDNVIDSYCSRYGIDTTKYQVYLTITSDNKTEENEGDVDKIKDCTDRSDLKYANTKLYLTALDSDGKPVEKDGIKYENYDIGNDNKVPIDIVYSTSLYKQCDFECWRVHVFDTSPTVQQLPLGNEYYNIDINDNKVNISAQNFSTYGIAFNSISDNPDNPGNNNSTNGSNNALLPSNTSDLTCIILIIFAIVLVFALGTAFIFKHNKR